MAREIKFRSWNEKFKIMVEVGLIDFLEEKMHLGSFEYGLGRFPIMQYTGLKDKNGTEIYHGDIMAAASYGGAPMDVRWDNHGGFYLHSQNNFEDDHLNTHEMIQSEVIGNIYQNPELLNG